MGNFSGEVGDGYTMLHGECGLMGCVLAETGQLVWCFSGQLEDGAAMYLGEARCRIVPLPSRLVPAR